MGQPLVHFEVIGKDGEKLKVAPASSDPTRSWTA